jgi:hypothetical protein
LVVMCWSGSDKYCVMDEVRVDVVYRTRVSVVNVQKGPATQLSSALEPPFDAP